MNSLHSASRPIEVFTLLAGLVLLACQGDPAASSSVCPGCEPVAGGETGDFGGSLTPCEYMSSRLAVSAEQASALGFDVNELQRRLAPPLDGPFYWQPNATEPEVGGPASGYDAQTRLEASISTDTSPDALLHVRPDPQYCDGTTCTRDGISVAQATCSHRLHQGLTVRFRTLDGALEGTSRGEAVLWIRGSEGEGADPAIVYGHTDLDLREATGSLVLTPNVQGRPHVGTLALSFQLGADTSEVSLMPSVWFDLPNRRAWYAPITGTSHPSTPAAVSGEPR
jgi:hypothetical protein